MSDELAVDLEVDLGPADEMRPLDLMVVPLRRDAHQLPRAAIVVRDVLGHLHAYLNRCEHLPIPLDAGGGRFLSGDGQHLVCQTHGAQYRISDGLCDAGPCQGASLQRFEVFERSGRLVLIDHVADAS